MVQKNEFKGDTLQKFPRNQNAGDELFRQQTTFTIHQHIVITYLLVKALHVQFQYRRHKFQKLPEQKCHFLYVVVTEEPML